MSVLTLSREKGSGGSWIADKVAGLLDYKVVDKELIMEAARELGVSEYSVEPVPLETPWRRRI